MVKEFSGSGKQPEQRSISCPPLNNDLKDK